MWLLEGYTFCTSSLPKSIRFANFSYGKSMLLAMLVKYKSKCGTYCSRTYNFRDFDLEKAKIGNFAQKTQLRDTYDVEFSVAKRIICENIGPANGGTIN